MTSSEEHFQLCKWADPILADLTRMRDLNGSSHFAVSLSRCHHVLKAVLTVDTPDAMIYT